MQSIQTTQNRFVASKATNLNSKPSTKAREERGPVDQVIFDARIACEGAIPGFGAAVNGLAALGTGIGGREKASHAFVGGMYANVLGTTALITGLALGNHLVRNAAFALLGIAGICGAYGAHQKS